MRSNLLQGILLAPTVTSSSYCSSSFIVPPASHVQRICAKVYVKFKLSTTLAALFLTALCCIHKDFLLGVNNVPRVYFNEYNVVTDNMHQHVLLLLHRMLKKSLAERFTIQTLGNASTNRRQRGRSDRHLIGNKTLVVSAKDMHFRCVQMPTAMHVDTCSDGI